MCEPTPTWHSRYAIPSKMDAAHQVVQEVLHQLQLRSWPAHDVFCVHLALEEALINAIKHGNRLDPAKQVHIGCWLCPASVRLEIADEGLGFDPEAIPDPTHEDGIFSTSGRGIMLMRSFMTSVQYADSGRRVILEKHRSAGHDPTPPAT